MDMLILNSQKLQVHELITKIGLKPKMFEWDIARSEHDDSIGVSLLLYIDTDYFFLFDFLDGKHCCTFSPGRDTPTQLGGPVDSWSLHMNRVLVWLNSLKREVETVDPWDDIDKYLPEEEIKLEDEKENSPFSSETVQHITNALHKLKDEIRESYNLDTEQDKLVQEKLDYLIDSSKKMGRKDWKILLLGIIVTLAVNLALDPEEVKGLWGLVKICFKGILLLGGSESG